MRGVLLFLGITAWVIALWFGAPGRVDPGDARTSGPASTAEPIKGAHVVAAASVAGFAIAGGVCFLAAARVVTAPSPGAGRGQTNFSAVLDQLRFQGVLTDDEYRAMMDKLEVRGAAPPREHPNG